MDDERDLALFDEADAHEADDSLPDSVPDEPVDGLDEQLAAAHAANADLLERLRMALLASDPGIDPALVSGATVEEVEASFEAARRTIANIRERVRREQAAAIPAGAPGRTSTGPTTAYDKIRAGLARLA